jgi:hypothetical protein
MGGDGSSAGRSLLTRLADNDDEGANQARFLGTSLVSDSGGPALAASAWGSDTNGMTGALLSGRSSGGGVVETAAAAVE